MISSDRILDTILPNYGQPSVRSLSYVSYTSTKLYDVKADQFTILSNNSQSLMVTSQITALKRYKSEKDKVDYPSNMRFHILAALVYLLSPCLVDARLREQSTSDTLYHCEHLASIINLLSVNLTPLLMQVLPINYVNASIIHVSVPACSRAMTNKLRLIMILVAYQDCCTRITVSFLIPPLKITTIYHRGFVIP